MSDPTLSEAETLAGIVAFMHKQHGLDLSCYEDAFLRRSLAKRQEARNCDNMAAYATLLTAVREEAGFLARALQVTYSEFFRNPLVFALLQQVVLPGLLAARTTGQSAEIRIWSAACAGGQEVWSVLLLLEELIASANPAVTCRLFATDLSASALDQARKGVYSATGLGNVPLRLLESGFTRRGHYYAIAEGLKKKVDFARYDLLEEASTCPPMSIYGEFDLVLCSNVLMYYQAAARRRILAKLRNCLAPGGWLVTGRTEDAMVRDAGGFRPVRPTVPVFQIGRS